MSKSSKLSVIQATILVAIAADVHHWTERRKTCTIGPGHPDQIPSVRAYSHNEVRIDSAAWVGPSAADRTRCCRALKKLIDLGLVSRCEDRWVQLEKAGEKLAATLRK